MWLLLAGVAEGSTDLSKEEGWDRFVGGGDRVFTGEVVRAVTGPVEGAGAAGTRLLITIRVDKILFGELANEVVVAFNPDDLFVRPPELGDGVVMSTSPWVAKAGISVMNNFLRSRPTPQGLRTVERDGTWVGSVDCEVGPGDVQDPMFVGGVAADGLPRVPGSPQALADKQRQQDGSLPWEEALATATRCLAEWDPEGRK